MIWPLTLPQELYAVGEAMLRLTANRQPLFVPLLRVNYPPRNGLRPPVNSPTPPATPPAPLVDALHEWLTHGSFDVEPPTIVSTTQTAPATTTTTEDDDGTTDSATIDLAVVKQEF